MVGLVLDLDRHDELPLYAQLARSLELAIQTGDLAPGERLETETAMAAKLRLSRPTVRRAIQELVNRGLLVRKRGIGTQVVTGPMSRQADLFSLHDDLTRARQEPGTEVLANEVLPASEEIAARLEVAPRTPVIRLRRLRLAQGQPLALLENYLPQSLVDLSTLELTTSGLYSLLRSGGVSIKIARQRIGARKGTDEECRLLAEPLNSTLLTVDRVAFDDSGRPVEWGRHLYRSSRYDIAMTLTRL